MSVLKSKRNTSSLEYYHQAINLRKEITELLLRDFGIKNKIRKSVSYTKNMSEEDAEQFQNLVDKYDCSYILEEYPSWLIDKFRSNIMNILFLMMQNIVYAYSINPVYESEYYERRNYQNRAISNCEQLLQEMQYIITVIPVNANKYMRYVEMINNEISLLKDWRKKDNKILRNIKKQQS